MLPKDPAILLSWVNTKLRDDYPSLGELCAALDADPEAIRAALAPLGYAYDEEHNKFC